MTPTRKGVNRLLDINDAMELKQSLLRVERAVAAHHGLLAKLANKNRGLFRNADDDQMATLSGGTNKSDPPPPPPAD